MIPIPKYPEFRPIQLEDRQRFEGIFKAMQPEISEYNFTNLFMFRHVHEYRISELNGNIAILAKSYSGRHYFLPPLGENMVPETIDAMIEHLKCQGCDQKVAIASREFIDKYIKDSTKYAFEYDEDNADYVYSASDLATLPGRKFHDKKNFLNRFLKSYPNHEYRRLTAELIPQAKELVVRWCQEKCSLEVPSTVGETEATLYALDNMDNLSSIGGTVLVNGKVEALAIGEPLNDHTAVVHVEKANSEFSGLYQFMASEFIAQEFKGYEFVNREQDLGEPNLRKSKLSYNPVKMVEKYTIRPKN
ncbi:MAG TPA: phosphatidylglycerol lysyltransferase domain-containing protein [Nitrospirota bacterium]